MTNPGVVRNSPPQPKDTWAPHPTPVGKVSDLSTKTHALKFLQPGAAHPTRDRPRWSVLIDKVHLPANLFYRPALQLVGHHIKTWQACSKAMSRALLLIPMQVCRYQVTHCPEGRLQLHWERATKAVHQIPRSKTTDSVTLDSCSASLGCFA